MECQQPASKKLGEPPPSSKPGWRKNHLRNLEGGGKSIFLISDHLNNQPKDDYAFYGASFPQPKTRIGAIGVR